MIAAIVLAAGESRRMGSPKARLPYPEPSGLQATFLSHLLSVLDGSRVDPLVLVLGHDADSLAADTDLGRARKVVNPSYRQGMLSSIRAGLVALEKDAVAGALICPVDHPDIEPAVVETLIERFERHPAPVVLPTHRGKRGHPVLFSHEVFPEIMNAPEDVGARRVVWDHESDVVEVEVGHEGVTLDIDTPDDYRDFRDSSR